MAEKRSPKEQKEFDDMVALHVKEGLADAVAKIKRENTIPVTPMTTQLVNAMIIRKKSYTDDTTRYPGVNTHIRPTDDNVSTGFSYLLRYIESNGTRAINEIQAILLNK
jgi:hypothetical protein